MHLTFLHHDWEFIETPREGQKLGYSQASWLPAEVPGHVHLDLMANGVIADPFLRMNEVGVQWVDLTDWSYRTKFEWEPKPGADRRVLRFEGLDTVCTVSLNGVKIAEHDNMFVPLEVDVAAHLKEGENELRVDFRSAVNVGEERKAEFVAANPDLNAGRLLERSFVRKVQCMYGWDWGPRLVSAGIWQAVQLQEFSSRILDVQVSQEHREDGTVVLHIVSETEGEGELTHFLVSDQDDEVLQRDGDGTILLQKPEKWFPVGYGDQPLYTLHSVFGEDERVTRLGLAETKLIETPDEFGTSFYFQVNGKQMWVRGANWIPDHSFPSAVSRTRYREQLERALDLGINMLRIWGGGLYELDDFYELCDELGILVWQDFPFACGYYPDQGEWQDVIREEATVNVKRIRNHVSLAIWCGNNENEVMFQQKWGGEAETPARFLGEHLYLDVLPKVVADTDPSRPYIPSSPTRGKDANSNEQGDQHYWDVWHGRGDWKYYGDSSSRFCSEYGFASACSMELWKDTLPPEDWAPDGVPVRWHDKTGKTWEVFSGFVKLHYPESTTLEDWTYYSQLNQRDALRFALEHFRRSEFCKGSLIWQINDCWPVQSWAFVDFSGRYKAAAYELRRVHADVMLAFHRKNERLEVWAINDSQEEVSGYVSLEASSLLTGEFEKVWDPKLVDLAPGQRVLALEADLTGLNVAETLISADLDGEFATWRLLSDPKDCRFTLPAITISTFHDGVLAIETDGPVVDLMLSSDDPTIVFDDNYVTVATADRAYVRVSKAPTKVYARSLAGNHPVKLVRGPI